MTITRMFRTGLGLVALLGGLSCGDESGTNPTLGTATVSLATPNADDGAVLITLTGPGLFNPQPGTSAYRVYFRVLSTDEVRVLVVGDLSDGILLTVGVDQVNQLGSYSGTVVEVASRTDQLQTVLTGYSLAFAAQ